MSSRKTPRSTEILELMQSFFSKSLIEIKGVSQHTVRSYRDCWLQFVRFVSAERHEPIHKLKLSHFDAASVEAFLRHCENKRGVSAGTRNCRLAAIRSFFRYVAETHPLDAGECSKVLRIPPKKTTTRAVTSLTVDEVETILLQPDRSKIEGQRDHVLFAFLYNTAARIQEALSLCPRDLTFGEDVTARLLGKGRKERIVLLWPETAILIRALLKRAPKAPDERIFTNRYCKPLGAEGARFKLKNYVKSASVSIPSLRQKKVTPHVFRHTAGCQMVDADVDITTIKDIFGHASLDTTNHYARSSTRKKREALEKADGMIRPGAPRRWKRDADLLAYLQSL